MTYLLNQEPVLFDDLWLFALLEGYKGARGPFWVGQFLWTKGYEVKEQTKRGAVPVGKW